MKAKFVNEDINDILKPKELSPEELNKYNEYLDELTLDDIYDQYLSREQQNYIEEILSNSTTIKGLYHDKWYKNGGWNGTMDAIHEFEEIRKIKKPNFDNLPEGINILELIMNAL
jgi:hypothetical protein